MKCSRTNGITDFTVAAQYYNMAFFNYFEGFFGENALNMPTLGICFKYARF